MKLISSNYFQQVIKGIALYQANKAYVTTKF